MVNGNVEETLNLVGVQVHRYQPVDAGNAKQVGNKLGSDAYAWFVLTVLTCPSEIRDNGIDGAYRGAFGSINH